MNFMEEIERRFSPRKVILGKGVLLLVVALIFMAVTGIMVERTARRALARKAEAARFFTLLDDYLAERAGIEPVEKRLLQPRSKDSVAAVIEEIGNATGVKSKINSLKPFEEKGEKGYSKAGTEVRLDGLTLNELVNFIYKADNYGNLLLIRDFNMKARFDNPELLDVTMQIVMVGKAS